MRIPGFGQDFDLYTFASNQSHVGVLTQRDRQGNEFAISFMGTNLLGVELNYQAIEKKTFKVYKW